mgnify:FL=1
MSSLRLISDTDLVDGVTTFSATDVFTDDFDIYKITINNLSHNSGSPAQISFRFINSAGSVITSSEYDSASAQYRSSNTGIENRSQNDTDSVIMGYADLSPEASGFVIYVFNPTNTSSFTFFNCQSSVAVSAALHTFKGIGVLTETTKVTGFQIIASSNTLDSGNMKVYGLRVD